MQGRGYLLGCWFPNFGSQILVFEVRSLNHFGERIAEKIRVFAVVEPEAHFVEVSREMLRRDFMPRSHDTALQEAESRFYGIGVNVSMRVFFGVVNRVMLFNRKLFQHIRVNHGLVREHYFNVTADIRVNNLAHGLSFGIVSPDQP